ncbi:hypothetical protein HNP55_002011 [Paucibacter oligotrophus]|uniref:Uncharacterized protein n=1 Tax=Roseateles oligotrophus TaxID=1769250 RepID=A0A840L9Z3_9BURK|nr:hypothetical protein [Roseateles oligotrophus]
MFKKQRRFLGFAIHLSGAALGAQFIVDWMRHSAS